MAEENERVTYQYSRYRKKFFEDGFKINCLGRRLKTCLECSVSKATYRVLHKESLSEYQKASRTDKKALSCLQKAPSTAYMTDAEIDEILTELQL